MSATLPFVIAFAQEMENKLAENRHKGDREGWSAQTGAQLLAMLKAEVAELEVAMLAPPRHPGADRAIRREAADVGNIAMFIADRLGGLGNGQPSLGVRVAHEVADPLFRAEWAKLRATAAHLRHVHVTTLVPTGFVVEMEMEDLRGPIVHIDPENGRHVHASKRVLLVHPDDANKSRTGFPE